MGLEPRIPVRGSFDLKKSSNWRKKWPKPAYLLVVGMIVSEDVMV